MDTLYASIVNEVQKIYLKKKNIVLLIVSALIPSVAAISVALLQGRTGINPVDSKGFAVFVLGYFTNLFLPLFIFMIAADSFAGETGDGTLKINLVRPVARFKVFFSKIAALGIYIVVSLGIVFIVSSISGLFLQGNTGLLQGLAKSFAAYCLAILPMLLLGTAASFVSQLFRNSSGALTFSIFTYMALKILGTIFPSASMYLPGSYNDWHLLWIGGSVLSRTAFYMFMFIVSYCIIFLSSGYYLFEKKQF